MRRPDEDEGVIGKVTQNRVDLRLVTLDVVAQPVDDHLRHVDGVTTRTRAHASCVSCDHLLAVRLSHYHGHGCGRCVVLVAELGRLKIDRTVDTSRRTSSTSVSSVVSVVTKPLLAPSARSRSAIARAASFLPVPTAPEMSTLRVAGASPSAARASASRRTCRGPCASVLLLLPCNFRILQPLCIL